MTSEAVEAFLQKENRPFSVNDILQSLGKDHGKAAVQKALDKLVAQNKAKQKTYGKQNIFCVAQDDTNPKETEKYLKSLNQEIEAASAELKTVENQLRIRTSELKSLVIAMTFEEAQSKLKALTEEVANLRSRLEEVTQTKKQSISEAEGRKIDSEHEKLLKEYRNRKGMCMEMLNTILEAYPKTKKHLLEEIGVETDDDAGFCLKLFRC